MTTYNTGNPIGSTAVKDLYDNAENLDVAVNSPATTWTDRLGVTRQTMAGATGYEFLGDYAAGIEITDYTQVVKYNNEFYRASASATLPFTTTGTWATDESSLVSVGDATLRQDLLAENGALLVGNASIYADTVADMTARSYPTGVRVGTLGYYDAGDGGHAFYFVKTAVDYGGTPDGYGDHYDAAGNVLVLQHMGQVNLRQFGAVLDGIADDAPSTVAAGAYFGTKGGTIKIPTGSLLINSSTAGTDYALIPLHPNVNYVGDGWESKIKVGDGVLGARNLFAFDVTAFQYGGDHGNISFKDFAVDLNGDNNLRLDTDPARNNAAVNTVDTDRIEINGIRVENAPGNQVFWVKEPTVDGKLDSVSIVKNCYIKRVANDITGNINGDHSSSYISGGYVYQINNVFEKTVANTTTETMMEAHGRYVYVSGNRGINYYRGLHVVANLAYRVTGDAPMEVANIENNLFRTRLAGVMLWDMPGSPIKDVNINNNIFDSTGYFNATSSINANSKVTDDGVHSLKVYGNTFRGATRTDSVGVSVNNLVENFSFCNNICEEMDGPLVESSATLSNIILNNTFYNCARGSGADKILTILGATKTFTCSSNSFTQTSYFSENSISIEAPVERAWITDNNFNKFFDDYPLSVTGTGVNSTCIYLDIKIYLAGDRIPPDADVYAIAGSKIVNLNGNTEYTRDTAAVGNSWAATA